jgi:DNA polymerase III epsilon subunit-like protein
MTRVIVFDVETTGLPSKYNAKVEELNVWPYVVQFSWIVYDIEEMDILKVEDHIIKLKNDMKIPSSSTKIHGITNEIMDDKGKSIEQVLYKFNEDILDCGLCVAHNLKFDKSMVLVESKRNNLDLSFDEKVEFCTMLYGEKICNLKRLNYKNEEVSKYPKLIELYEKLFGETPTNLHNSLYDVLVCLRCFYKLRFNEDLLTVDDKLAGYQCF